MPSHREPPVPSLRYARLLAAGTSVAVTLVAVMGATGVVSARGTAEAAAATERQSPDGAEVERDAASWVGVSARAGASIPMLLQSSPSSPSQSSQSTQSSRISQPADPPIPAGSGSGRRVVFDEAAQQVWLVDARERVQRSYPVSGSVTDNLQPGRYEVYSTSLDAVGIDDSGTMRYMVRFAYGDRAAIGFHDIPVHDGRLVQSAAQLGTPRSHGCIRQLRADARALWEFAPVGTKVVVV